MNSITLNGVSSTTIKGLLIQSLPPISKPAMRVQVEEIDGRDGDIVTDLGYQAYDKSFMIGLYGAYDVDQVIAFFASSGEVIFSNEPDKVYRYKTISAIDFERLIRFKQATVTLHVQPYKTSASETPESVKSTSFMDSEPYLFRKTPDGANMEIDEIVGGSVAWNQLEQGRTDSSTAYGITFSYSDGLWTFSGTCTQTNIAFRLSNNNKPIQTGHKILLTNTSSTFKVRLQGFVPSTSALTPRERILEAQDGAVNDIVVMGFNMNGVAVNENDSFGIIDLTLMFGSTIADYIYAQEQASAGAGVAFFRNLFNKPYYPYNAGEIISVKTSAHKMVGFNQWDEEWELGYYNSSTGLPVSATNQIRSKNYIPVIGGADYYVLSPKTCVKLFYDASYAFISATSWTRGAFTAPSNARYIRVNFGGDYGATYNNDICINLSDPSKNGTYEPYTAHEYPLESSLTLRGLPKLDGDSIYYDGDIYHPSGEVTRRYRYIEVTSCGSVGTTSTGRKYAYIPLTSAQAFLSATDAISNAYTIINSVPPDDEKYARFSGSSLYLYDARFTDKATADSILASEKPQILYALATPTTEQAEPYTNPQVVLPGGTEEYISEREAPLPVGHNTKYIVPIDVTVTNDGNTNSEPVMTIEGSGTINVSVNGSQIFTIDMGDIGEITIDAEALEAYSGSTLMNRRVTGDYSNFVLHPGENIIEVSGDASNVTIERYSRWI